MDAVWLSFVGGLLGGFLGAVATLFAARIREKGAKREEWWRRVQWAADLSLGQDAVRRSAGLNILDKLAGSRLATEDDVRIVDVFADPAVLPLEALPDDSTVARNRADAHDEAWERP